MDSVTHIAIGIVVALIILTAVADVAAGGFGETFRVIRIAMNSIREDVKQWWK